MRRAWWLVSLVVAGCSGAQGAAPDASGAAGGGETCPPAPGPICPASCGNNVVDGCYGAKDEDGLCITSWQLIPEVCDGTAPIAYSCPYGGTPTCRPDCRSIDLSSCPACPAGATCVTTPDGGDVLVASAGYLASADPWGMQLFAGATPTVTAPPPANGIAPTSTGWLISDGVGLVAVGFDGTTAVVSQTAPLEIGPGPGGLVTVVQITSTAQRGVGLVDASGTLVVPLTARDLGAAQAGARLLFATNGTQGFIANPLGTLFTISADGTFATTGAFSLDAVAITWGTTFGWLVGQTSTQRFDATGHALGDPISLPVVARTAIADGDDLIVLSTNPQGRLVAQRIKADGTSGAQLELGETSGGPSVARLGADLYVAWYSVQRGVLEQLVVP